MIWLKVRYWLFWHVLQCIDRHGKEYQIRFVSGTPSTGARWEWRCYDSNWAGGEWSSWAFLRYGLDTLQEELTAKAHVERWFL